MPKGFPRHRRFWFIGLFLGQGHGDGFGGDGQFPMPDAGGAVDGVGNGGAGSVDDDLADGLGRSEEHTSELQSRE